MTVTVDVSEGIKTGSAVREVSNSTPWLGILFAAGNELGGSYKGEAVVV